MYFILHGKSTQFEGLYFNAMPTSRERKSRKGAADTKSKDGHKNIINTSQNSSIISNKYSHHHHKDFNKKLALVFRLGYIQQLRKCAKKVMKVSG